MDNLKVLSSMLFVLSIFMVSGSATTITANSSVKTVQNGASYLDVYLMNQDPYPADPGSYVTLAFKVENFGSVSANNVTMTMEQAYPFSLDSGVSATQTVGLLQNYYSSMRSALVTYTVRVDDNALNGNNELTIDYTVDGYKYTKSFNISVSNPRTDFEVVSQGTTSGSTSLAVANTGAQTAYALVVSIPTQDAYKASGVSAAVLGNLAAGDYSMTSFEVSGQDSAKPLTVQLAYTDALGIRRTVLENVSLGATASSAQTAVKTAVSATTSSSSDGTTYIIIGIVGIVIVVGAFKLIGGRKK